MRVAWWALVPGPVVLEVVGFPEWAWRFWPVVRDLTRAVVGVLVVGWVESHMVGAVAVNRVRPWVSRPVMSPAGSLDRVAPLVWAPRARVARWGLAAAWALWTTRTSLNPPLSCAVTARSTPGSTAW